MPAPPRPACRPNHAPCATRLVLCAMLLVLAACADVIPGITPDSPQGAMPGMESASDSLALATKVSLATQGLSSFTELASDIRASLAYVNSQNMRETAVDLPWLTLTWADMKISLEQLLAMLPLLDKDPTLLGRHFTWVRMEPDTLLTGYFEPFLHASLSPKPGYPYPLYTKPPDRFSPLPDRRAIDFGHVLQGLGLEIAWATDLLDVYFLQVQGSGRLLLDDGREVHVLYNGANGRPYVSLGKELAARGYASRDEMSMQKIREIIEAEPWRTEEFLSINPKYIFFKLADEGPFGSSRALLTPYVSVATDKSYIPNGAIMALSADLPAPQGELPFFGLVLSHDTGTMDRNHVDLFCGSGDTAAYMAGHLQARARTWVLVSRSVLER